MRRAISSALLMAVLLVAAGCKGPASTIQGKYSQYRGNAKLEVTGGAFILASDGATITYNYQFISVEGNTTLLNVSYPGDAQPRVVKVTVVDNGLDIRGDRFDGKWIRW